MELLDRLHLVGGGPIGGFGITPGPDSHVYLLDGGDGLALIDCGAGTEASAARLVENIERSGYQPSAIDSILLTHFHGDHAGGASQLARESGAEVHVHGEAADAISGADEAATGVAAGRAAGIYPDDYRLRPVDVAGRLTDGDVVTCGDLSITTVATPGHCRGHASFLVDVAGIRCLFAGDALFWGGQILLQAIPDCDLQASVASIRRLAELEFDALLPGHGPVTVQGGHAHAAMALEKIEALGVPRNLL